MAAPYNPPVRGEDFKVRVSLRSAANALRLKANPTIAAGDFKITKDGGALANLATLPAVEPAGSIWVEIVLSATEMTADDVGIQCIDQTDPPEWADLSFNILTTA